MGVRAKKGRGGKILGVFIALIALIVAAGVALNFVFDREKKDLTKTTRAKLGGTYQKLSAGVTHYRLAGPENGQVVVLVPGATVPMWDWTYQVPALTKAGFRVLTYNHYGRGYSDRVTAVYNRALYRRQLLDLLDKLKLKKPVHLVGHSFGGAVVTDFTAHYPARVSKLVLVAPLINSVLSDGGIKLLRLPVIGGLLLRMIGIKTMTKRATALFQEFDNPQKYKKLFSDQFAYKGTTLALLSFFRSDAMRDYRPLYKKLGSQKRPILLIWGDKDHDISRPLIDWVRKVIPGLKFVELKGVGHSPNIEVPKKFNFLLIGFLKQ